jgi:hypothetical protein
MPGWRSTRTRRAEQDVACDPAFALAPGDPLAEEIVVAQFWKGRQRNNHVRVTLKRFEGRPIIDVRQFFVTTSGHSQPTTRGIAMSVARLPELLKAIEKGYGKAIALDLIEAAE